MIYQITPYTKAKAKKLNVLITPSTRKNKKIDVFTSSGKYITSIGDNKYLDFPNYLIQYGKEYANKRRKAYKKRHEKDRHKKGSAGYYADQLLW